MSEPKKIDVHYKIEKGVDIPVRAPAQLKNLEVGDSFTFPIAERVNVASRASFIKRTTGKEFTTKRLDDETCRVWRTK